MTQQQNPSYAEAGMQGPAAPHNPEQGNGQPFVAAAPPLLYKSPTMLRADIHRDAGILPSADLGFARQTAIIPLLTSEFATAARYYPIVFTISPDNQTPVTPLAIVGLHAGQNLFIEPDGRWKAGFYIPAYVRRYPFLVSETNDQAQQVLLVDSQAHNVVQNAAQHPGAWRLFTDDGAPSEQAQHVINFCREWYSQTNITAAFSQALGQETLLMSNSIDLQLPDGGSYRVDGFSTIDQGRVNALPDATLLHWVKQGWYALLVLHMISQQNWSNLAGMSASA